MVSGSTSLVCNWTLSKQELMSLAGLPLLDVCLFFKLCMKPHLSTSINGAIWKAENVT